MHKTEKKSIQEITGAAEANKEQAEQLIRKAIPQERPAKKKSPEILPFIPDGFTMYHKEVVKDVEVPEEGRVIPVSFPAGLYYKADRARLHTVKNVHTGKKETVKTFMPSCICQPFKVTAEINNQQRTDRALLVEWEDKRGTSHRKEVRPSDLHLNKEKAVLFSELTKRGLIVPSDRAPRQSFQNFLEKVFINKYLTRFESVGWNKINEQDFYALSDGRSYPKDESVYIPDLTSGNSLYECKGTLQDWKTNVAAYADKNKYLALGISLSFAGPLLKWSNLEGGGISFAGDSRKGKSTILKASASIWGKIDVQVQSWHATDPALERSAFNVNDGVLFLDEMGQSGDKSLSQCAYMLANGSGKGRYTEDKIRKFKILFLSTSEKGLKCLIEQNGQKSNAGQEVRVPDLWINDGRYGAFDEKYNFKDGEDFSTHLNEAVNKNYGVAGDEWLKELTKQDLKIIAKRITTDMKHFLEEVYGDKERQPQATTVLKRFALCAVAGELATEWRILPWEKGTATRLILDVAKKWLSERGTGSIEEMRVLETFKSVLEMQEERFQLAADGIMQPRNRLGWKEGGKDGFTFFLTKSGLKDIFKGEEKFAKKTLLKKDALKSWYYERQRTNLYKRIWYASGLCHYTDRHK